MNSTRFVKSCKYWLISIHAIFTYFQDATNYTVSFMQKVNGNSLTKFRLLHNSGGTSLNLTLTMNGIDMNITVYATGTSATKFRNFRGVY